MISAQPNPHRKRNASFFVLPNSVYYLRLMRDPLVVLPVARFGQACYSQSRSRPKTASSFWCLDRPCWLNQSVAIRQDCRRLSSWCPNATGNWRTGAISSRRKQWPEQRDKQDEQGVVRDACRVAWRGAPGGPLAAWLAGYAVLDGERYEGNDALYAALHVGQGASGGRSLEREKSWGA